VDGISGRERLRQTFDGVAAAYQDARPDYPQALYAALISLTSIDANADSLCEVGSGPGKATLPLARRGFAVMCVELGAALAAQARRNLAGFDRVTVVNADFESWVPDGDAGCGGTGFGGTGFGLVFAATAWHWIDPAVKYGKAWSLLKPDRLNGEIRRRLALRPDGRVRRHWGAVLNVARKLQTDRLALRLRPGNGRRPA
jgi:SAM-dependent methyltransferase